METANSLGVSSVKKIKTSGGVRNHVAVGCQFRPPLSQRATQPCPLDRCPMFAFLRTWVEDDFFPMLSLPVYTLRTGKKKEGLPPDFLRSLLALANLMRLSSLNAAHAATGECHVAGNPGRDDKV